VFFVLFLPALGLFFQEKPVTNLAMELFLIKDAHTLGKDFHI